MSILRSARILALFASATLLAAALAPSNAPASPLAREERAHAREERAHEREERAHEREQRARERAQHADERREHRAARTTGGCRLTAQASAQHITVGEGVDLLGALVCGQASSAGERLVTIYRATRDALGGAVGTVTTAADGSYRLQIASLEASTLFVVRAGHARGTRVAVKVAPRVTLASPETTPAAQGARAMATFSGTVGPAYAGAPVTLQSAFTPTAPRWKTIAYGRVDAQGAFSITRGFRLPGERWIRAVVHPASGYVPGASEPVAYDVPGAQNPALTIESSAPLVGYGQPVTISGVSARGAGQPVALFARSSTGSFQQVLSAVTGEGGRYSFTQQPLQRSRYEVREGPVRSAALMEEVGVSLTPTDPPASIEAGQQLTFTGSLDPAVTGERVELERENASGLGFRVIASAPVQDGSYSLPYTFRAGAAYTLRIVAQAGPGVESTACVPFTLQVSPSAGAPPLLAL